jgi:hypothetical protein
MPGSRFTLLLSLIGLLLVGCRIDSSILRAWERAEVYPAFVCPGDLVTVDWEMGVTRTGCLSSSDEGLRECMGYSTITSSPDVFVPPAPSDHHTGIELVSISADTTFTFNGRQDGSNWATVTRSVSLLAPTALSTANVLFEGVCSGSSYGWAPVDMRLLASENSEVDGVCNTNGYEVTVSSSALDRGLTLGPLECTDIFNGSPGILTVAPAEVTSLIAGVECSPTRANPPAGVELQVGLRCTSGSASEAIMAATSESTPEEPVTFITDTPTAAEEPTAAPISINFNADSYSLISGECTRLRWAVENADEVQLEGEPVPATEAEQVCPTGTTTYQLTAGNAVEQQESFVTIEVSQPAGPPSAPTKLSIGNRQCSAQAYSLTLEWKDNADDETGYRIYREGQLIATLGANAESYSDDPPYGGPYQYGVEAYNDSGASSRPTVQEQGCIY